MNINKRRAVCRLSTRSHIFFCGSVRVLAAGPLRNLVMPARWAEWIKSRCGRVGRSEEIERIGFWKACPTHLILVSVGLRTVLVEA